MTYISLFILLVVLIGMVGAVRYRLFIEITLLGLLKIRTYRKN